MSRPIDRRSVISCGALNPPHPPLVPLFMISGTGRAGSLFSPREHVPFLDWKGRGAFVTWFLLRRCGKGSCSLGYYRSHPPLPSPIISVFLNHTSVPSLPLLPNTHRVELEGPGRGGEARGGGGGGGGSGNETVEFETSNDVRVVSSFDKMGLKVREAMTRTMFNRLCCCLFWGAERFCPLCAHFPLPHVVSSVSFILHAYPFSQKKKTYVFNRRTCSAASTRMVSRSPLRSSSAR
jgi:hypothetical protein